MTRYAGYVLLILAGGGFYLAFEQSIGKAIALVVGSLLIDVGLDMALLRHEQKKEEDDEGESAGED